jgi:hypothetical protein
VTQGYDGTDGLYEFTWDPGVPAGSSNSGNFVLTAQWYSGDPFDEFASGDPLGEVLEFSVPYSVTVPPSCNCTPVPETSSFQTLACGFAGIGALFLFNRSRKKLQDVA